MRENFTRITKKEYAGLGDSLDAGISAGGEIQVFVTLSKVINGGES